MSNSQIVVTFSPPASDGGKPITSYTAACVSSDGGPLGFANSTSSPVAVGATNGHMYACHVTATNADGTSPASPDSPSVLVDAPPDPPTQPTVTAGDAQIVVGFTAPNDNGSAIVFYFSACTSQNGGLSGDASSASSPITVPGLSNGRTYRCTVIASNGAGPSMASPVSQPVVPVGATTAPAPPTIVSLVSGPATGSTGALVASFTPGANHGSPIRSYRVRCAEIPTGARVVGTGTKSPIRIRGLLTAKTYSCAAVAISATGTSAISNPARSIVGVPGRPTSVKAKPATKTAIQVTFTAPANNGAKIWSYLATCTSPNGGATKTNRVSRAPITVSGLTAGRTYNCTVSATNSRGTGPPSAKSAAVDV